MRRALALGRVVYLRKPDASDADEFIAAVRTHRSHLEPYVHPADDASAFERWLTRGTRQETEQFLVCRRDDDAIAGFVNLNEIQRGGLQQAAAGWAGFPPHLGQGRLTEGLHLVLEVAFTQLRLHRVEANIQPGNERSRAMAVRAGFRMEGFSPRYLRVGGRWRDHERWAILEDEWRAAAPRR